MSTLLGAVQSEPGLLAAGIKEVLSVSSKEAASQTLADLGYTALAMAPAAVVAPSVPVSEIGGEGTPSHEAGGVSGAVQSMLGDVVPPPTSPERRDDDLPRIKLRSYVVFGPSTGRQAPGTANQEQRTKVDEAGISRVLSFEARVGREPTEMPHNNEGYDVESRMPAGDILRYIEVKSLSGYWNPQNDAAMSYPQFSAGQKKKDLYWLYVVERADQEDFRIYRIQNPATRVDEFRFDDIWKKLTEPDPEAEKEEHGED